MQAKEYDKTTRKRAGTNLTDGEKKVLYQLQAVLHTDGEADTLRALVREAGLAHGFIPKLFPARASK